MSEKIVIRLSDENASAIEREYDELIERRTSTLRAQGWQRQADVVEAELSEADLATKVSRLLEYNVDEVDA